MNEVLEKIQKIGIVPVVVLDDAKDAAPLAKALCEGGLPCAEVTFRTAAAEESIRIMAKEFPEMLVGAGTVLTTEQVDRAVNAGAKFIVSPGLNPTVVKYCVDKGIPVTPGTSNPSDVEMAISLGLDVVKFFPAEQAGGINAETLKETSELLHGSFTYTVLDSHAQLFIVRGNNPFCLYHFPALGFYVYASTKEILNAALRKFRKHIPSGRFEEIAVKEGEILRISRDGIRKTQTFSLDFLFPLSAYLPLCSVAFDPWNTRSTSYVDELKRVAGAFGYLPEDVDDLIFQSQDWDCSER